MKIFLFGLCLVPGLLFASPMLSKKTIATYQQLCAKEQNPLKRQAYCAVLENNSRILFIPSFLRKDTAIV